MATVRTTHWKRLISNSLKNADPQKGIAPDIEDLINANPEKYLNGLRDKLREDAMSAQDIAMQLSVALPVWTDSFAVKSPYSEAQIIEAILNALGGLIDSLKSETSNELDSQGHC